MPEYIRPPSSLGPGAVVWSYLRDSGGDSQEQSIRQQQDEIKEYCHRYKLVLGHVFSDIAKSGGSVISRNAFHDMIDMANSPDLKPDGLLIWNFARFARDLDDANYFKSMLRRQGIIVHSITDPIPEGPFGRMVETLIDISNEEKLRQNKRDVKRSLRALVKQGYSCGGTPPRGYKSERVTIGRKRNGDARIVSKWIPDPELWDLVKLAWKMRAGGKSYSDIRDATGGQLYKSKSCFASFFQNKSYLGVGKCGDLEVPDHHPAAIDHITWSAVQEIRKENQQFGTHGKRNHPRRIHSPSLLSGIASCMHCGSAVNIKTSGNGWLGYICGKKNRQGWKSCQGRLIGQEKADKAIVNAVLDRILTPDYFSALLVETRSSLSDTEEIDMELKALRKGLLETEISISNLLDLAECFGAASAADRLREREMEQDRLKMLIGQLEAKLSAASLEISAEALELALSTWRGKVKDAFGNNDIRALRKILEHFVSKIKLDYGLAQIYYTYPLDSFALDAAVQPQEHVILESSQCINIQLG